ncbi:MAG: fumarylacetoacetate hydrolase family protein [Gammaproteobacteria bacterium]|nr:fumarylacetoacetate hydrolase family protein [Gammaproteobacteria bacterium]
MKLATLKNNTRDGQLLVVDSQLKKAILVPDIAITLQQALDDWNKHKLALEQVYQDLNNNLLSNAFAFNPTQVMAPLPRAYQWADASAYVSHVELVRKSRGVTMPENFWTDPLMYQGGSDKFLGPTDDIKVADLEYGVDFEAEVAIITSDVPMACDLDTAEKSIILLMLVNDVSLRNLAVGEVAKGFGFFQCKPASSFSPVAITPDELNDNWQDGKIHLPIISKINNNIFGRPNAGVEMTFNFPRLIVHAAKTRELTAGTIIGSGTVSNLDRSTGSSCIVEKRSLETINSGKAETSYLNYGDTVSIEMLDHDNNSIFGCIEQRVAKY